MKKNFNMILSIFLILTILFSSFSVVFSASWWPSMTKTEKIAESEDSFNDAFNSYKKTVAKKFIFSTISKVLPDKYNVLLKIFKINTESYGVKDMWADYINIFWMPYIGEGTGDSPEMLAEVVTNLTEKDWSSNTIKNALWRVAKTLVFTTNGFPTKDDLNTLKTDLTNQETYYADLPIPTINNEPIYTYSTIQDLGRMCNFSSMFSTHGEKIWYFQDNNQKIWSYSSEDSAKIACEEKHISTDNIKDIDNPNQEGKPICIIKDVKFKNTQTGESETAYLVALAGTSFTSGQSSGLIADVLSGCESNSPYLQKALEAIKTIPAKTNGERTKIVIAGFSLGGMIAQQIMVQPNVYQTYDIRQVVLLGCPALCVESTERTNEFKKEFDSNPKRINRVIDQNDFIPYCSADYIRNENTTVEIFENFHEDKAIKNGSTYKTFVGTHFLGYMQAEAYKNYDIFGFYKTEAEYGWEMEVNYNNAEHFAAPNRFVPDKISIIE